MALPNGFIAQQGKGRPKGSINQLTKELLEWGEVVLNSEEWKASAKRRMLAGEAPHLETYLAQRIHGRPKEIIEVQNPVPLFALPPSAFVAVTMDDQADADAPPKPH